MVVPVQAEIPPVKIALSGGFRIGDPVSLVLKISGYYQINFRHTIRNNVPFEEIS